jgi:hypothetical protein
MVQNRFKRDVVLVEQTVYVVCSLKPKAEGLCQTLLNFAQLVGPLTAKTWTFCLQASMDYGSSKKKNGKKRVSKLV